MRIGVPSPFAAPGGQPPPPEPPPGPPRRKHTGGRHTTPEAEQAVLRELGKGESVKAAAKAAGVHWETAKAIWVRAGNPWPPPGWGKGTRHRGRPQALTPQQAAEAARRIRGNETHAAVARDLEVSPATLYRALGRLGDGKP